jgi:hypothetical protein
LRATAARKYKEDFFDVFDNPPMAASVLGTTVKRLFTVIIIVVGVLILAVLSVVGFLTTKYVAR